MKVRVVLGAVGLATLGVVPLAASADPLPVPPACVVVDSAPLHAQVGYAPNGPADCTTLP
jgi:hypothetical protein